MKFNRLIDLEWNWTKRKEAALLRKYEREVDLLPLFEQEIRAEQPSVESVKLERQNEWIEKGQRERVRRAGEWKRGRALLFQLSAEHRRVVRNLWNLHKWRTHEPHYFNDLLYGYIVKGNRPTKAQIEIYGDAFQPVDYCSVNFDVIRVSPKKSHRAPTKHEASDLLNQKLF